MCSLASQTCRRAGLLNCCHGIGTIRTCRWSLELGIMLYAIRGPRRVLSNNRTRSRAPSGSVIAKYGGLRSAGNQAPEEPSKAENAKVKKLLADRQRSALPKTVVTPAVERRACACRIIGVLCADDGAVSFAQPARDTELRELRATLPRAMLQYRYRAVLWQCALNKLAANTPNSSHACIWARLYLELIRLIFRSPLPCNTPGTS